MRIGCSSLSPQLADRSGEQFRLELQLFTPVNIPRALAAQQGSVRYITDCLLHREPARPVSGSRPVSIACTAAVSHAICDQQANRPQADPIEPLPLYSGRWRFAGRSTAVAVAL